MKKYYVYQLISSLTNEIFYIGKGSGNRMLIHSRIALGKSHARNRNPKLYNKIVSIINNGGEVIPLKIFETINENDALIFEIDLINKIGLKNLCNLTLGGEGTSFPNGFSEEHKKNISKSKLGKPRLKKDGTNYVCSDKTKKLLSISATGRKGFWKNKNLDLKTKLKMSVSHKNKTFSDDHKKNLSKALKGIKNGKKRFVPTKDELEQAFLKFKTQKLIAKYFNCSQRTIGRRLKESNIK